MRRPESSRGLIWHPSSTSDPRLSRTSTALLPE
nr:MAG TPA: hypothetical protein [Caudoviricetes sp.]